MLYHRVWLVIPLTQTGRNFSPTGFGSSIEKADLNSQIWRVDELYTPLSHRRVEVGMVLIKTVS